jgi:SAM-dependent methyltransferase
VRLFALKFHWDRLGRRDPYWAVLTDPDKRRGGWDLEQFFRTGSEEIASILERAEQLRPGLSRHRALDFGCGVGRLTQAMADQFERCDGVDISVSMLCEARRHNRHPDNCSFHLNTSPDLALFADETFDFVYSTLVLQHIEPQYSKSYVRELLRVLASDGLLVFQLPSEPIEPARPATAPAASTPIPGPLPAQAFKARITADSSSLSGRADDRVALEVKVENCSAHTWPALPDFRGRRQINLANQWLDARGEVLRRDDARCPLPYDLAPGATAQLTLHVTTPRSDGACWLELDLVQENVSWFAQRGSDALRIPCRVAGGILGPRSLDEAQEAAGKSKPEPPFRTRHPRLFHVLHATGLRDAYWAWRRAVDRVKTRRDRLVGTLTAPLINWWRRKPLEAKMKMHCVPRDEVLALLTAGGGRLVHEEEEQTPGFLSRRYWVAKG